MSELKDYYVYPAVVYFDDDGVGIEFPDLPGCFSCVELDAENIPLKIIHNAREAMSLHLFNMEDDGDVIPEPTDILSVKHKKNQAVILVDAYMPLIRDKHSKIKPVNKMCTIPEWLESAAKHEGINFSQTLQNALIEKLGTKR